MSVLDTTYDEYWHELFGFDKASDVVKGRGLIGKNEEQIGDFVSEEEDIAFEFDSLTDAEQEALRPHYEKMCVELFKTAN